MPPIINYEYPTTQELREINPEKIQLLERDRPTFSIFPQVDTDAWTLEWEVKDNWMGFQQLRGLNGQPSYVKMVGERAFSAEPGVFGEFMTIDEKMLTMRARNTRVGEPIDISSLVVERQDYLNLRELDLIEYIHWKALLDGQFSFVGPTGATYADQLPIQTAAFSDWSNLATATPLADLLGLKELTVGKSISFGTAAQIFLNSTTLSYVLRNRNANDLGGQLAVSSGGVKPLKALGEINTILTGHGLPQLVEYDEGYFAEPSGTFTRWIPTDVLSLVGARTNGEALGEYRMVRNANNENMAPGRYEEVIDNAGEDIPRQIEVHRGHNGGLVIFYGSAIVKITC